MPVRTLSWAVRSSGRDIAAVRRPLPSFARATAEKLKKAELVAAAEERGLDTDGTKAELVDRLTGGETDG